LDPLPTLLIAPDGRNARRSDRSGSKLRTGKFAPKRQLAFAR
jgi:hypothetical protein